MADVISGFYGYEVENGTTSVPSKSVKMELGKTTGSARSRISREGNDKHCNPEIRDDNGQKCDDSHFSSSVTVTKQ